MTRPWPNCAASTFVQLTNNHRTSVLVKNHFVGSLQYEYWKKMDKNIRCDMTQVEVLV